MKLIKKIALEARIQYNMAAIARYNTMKKRGSISEKKAFRKITLHFQRLLKAYAECVKLGYRPIDADVINGLKDLEAMVNK